MPLRPVTGIAYFMCCIYCNVSFILCVALFAVFSLSVVNHFMSYVSFCMLCLIVVPPPPGKTHLQFN
jgi:hypothetical protein